MKNIAFKFLNDFIPHKRGNVAVIFAIAILPVVGAGGLAIDYARIHSTKAQVQNSMDAALLAGTKETQRLLADGKSKSIAISSGTDLAKEFYKVNNFNQKIKPTGTFTPQITVSDDNIDGSATFSGQNETSFSKVFGITNVNLNVDANVNISAPRFYQFHIVIDNSNSMGVGATNSAITTMANSPTNCAFACHVPDASTAWQSTIEDVRDLGVKLRIDVVKDSVKTILNTLDAENLGVQVKTAIYTLSNNLVTHQSLTTDISQATQAVDDIELAGDWGTGGTSFDYALNQLENQIGSSGNAATQSSAKRIVVLVSDGVATNIKYDQASADDVIADNNFKTYNPVFNGTPGNAWNLQGFNPKACDDIKTLKKAEVYTINVEYKIPTVGTDDDIRFKTIEDELKPKIYDNMKQCATSEDNFFLADSPSEIQESFNSIIEDILAKNLTLTN